MKRTLCAIGFGALCLTCAAPSQAAVLCQKRSGAVFVRTTCKKKETVLNLAQFGAVGPKGNPGAQGPPGVGPLTSCPPDSVLVGTTCVDKYEASVWQIAPSNTALVQKVQAGTVTLADLTGGGATQLSPAQACSPAFPANFPNDGNWTPVGGSSPPSPGVYATSIPGVHPTACIDWFQAAQACALSGKRLLINEEWQRAASGTPDPGTDNGTTDCAISSTDVVNTGSRSNCMSNWGAFDMVGNVDEWVADWVPVSTACPGWGGLSDDLMCLAGASTTANGPGALFRGGSIADGTAAGVFSVDGTGTPLQSVKDLGFRCAR